MIQVENLAKSYGPQTLYRGASFVIGHQDRVGLMGPNGAGKTTFFRMLMGEESPDEGNIRTPKNFTKALLRQEWMPNGDDSVLVSLLKVHERWYQAQEALLHTPPTSQAYLEAESLFHSLGGYQVEPRAKELLTGLGFSASALDQPCRLFSGGWRMRVQLAGLLLAEPDILLLDEPTNHLDIESVAWFEDFLSNYPKAYMVISHDRHLIARLSTSILEFTPPKLSLWPVPLHKFEEDKAIRLSHLENQIRNKEKKIEQLQDFVSRFKAKASKARQAQSKLKSSDAIESEVEKLRSEMPLFASRRARFSIQHQNRMPKSVYTFDRAQFGYTKDKVLFDIPHCLIEGGKKVGIIGVNGIGKSTFLKVCAGELPLLSGDVRRSETLRIGYFAQHRIEDLPLTATAYEYLLSHAHGLSISEVRGRAASLGISAYDLDKSIKTLSGGEKARVSLAKILMDKPDILLLDEPTNHLDIEGCDAIIEGLKDYGGTVLIVSHDRDFLDAVAQLLLEIKHGEAILHYGNYSDWMHRKTLTSVAQTPKEQPSKSTSHKVYKTKEQRRLEALARQNKAQPTSPASELKQVELDMTALQATLAELDGQLAQPEAPKSDTFLSDVKKRHSLAQDLERLEERYLTLLQQTQDA